MSEKVIVRQNRNYETSFLSLDPHAAVSDKPRRISQINELTPYGMVLAGIATCTGFVVNTYAEHHNIPVDSVKMTMEYGRNFKKDCDHCEEIDKYEDQINMTVSFEGKLSAQEREKLFKISLQCPVHKMVKNGIKVNSRPG